MFWPLELILRHTVVDGDLTVVDARGRTHAFGNGSGPNIAVRLADRSIEHALVLDPQLALGEGYLDGRMMLQSGSIYDFIALLMRNLDQHALPAWTRFSDVLRWGTRRIQQYNPERRARRNISRHYDIDAAIYRLFLDQDFQYSCAYFTPGADLDEAQRAKKAHIAAKLALQPGHRVLDIGCGWGGMAMSLARAAGCSVKGITLSKEQLAIASERARKQGFASTVTFDLEDYREVKGTFDRIVSVGMFEHVGVNHYRTYFRQVNRLLAPDGVALLHSIGRSDGPGYTSPFIAKYIFPGGYFPALSEVVPAIESAGLIVTDVEILRLHYAETLKAWRERFVAHWDEAVALKGEEFCRMWEFYLAGSEAAFRHQGLVVFQIQLAKRIDALPITRDYMMAAERTFSGSDGRDSSSGTRLAGE
jgi:cyclopropane-fatty-acyl-phospholipid synthase